MNSFPPYQIRVNTRKSFLLNKYDTLNHTNSIADDMKLLLPNGKLCASPTLSCRSSILNENHHVNPISPTDSEMTLVNCDDIDGQTHSIATGSKYQEINNNYGKFTLIGYGATLFQTKSESIPRRDHQLTLRESPSKVIKLVKKEASSGYKILQDNAYHFQSDFTYNLKCNPSGHWFLKVLKPLTSTLLKSTGSSPQLEAEEAEEDSEKSSHRFNFEKSRRYNTIFGDGDKYSKLIESNEMINPTAVCFPKHIAILRNSTSASSMLSINGAKAGVKMFSCIPDPDTDLFLFGKRNELGVDIVIPGSVYLKNQKISFDKKQCLYPFHLQCNRITNETRIYGGTFDSNGIMKLKMSSDEGLDIFCKQSPILLYNPNFGWMKITILGNSYKLNSNECIPNGNILSNDCIIYSEGLVLKFNNHSNTVSSAAQDGINFQQKK